VALVLANDMRSPVGIIRNASAVAARIRGANHLSEMGRRKLFGADYPLAWGNETVAADAFVTGTAEISKDLRTLTLSVDTFDKRAGRPAQFGKDVVARNDVSKLAEMNESFRLRGGFDNGTVEEKRLIADAARIKSKKEKHPTQDNEVPVRLEVLYNGKRVAVTHRDGKAYLPEPKRGEKVTIRLRRDGRKERYGVVLKVNGENTIARQQLPDLQCRRWILEPGKGPVAIRGYQIDNDKAEEFRVLSAAESKKREINYGADVGTISLTVFRERRGEEVKDPGEPGEAKRERIVASGALPQRKSYKELRADLFKENDTQVRGLIAPGEKVVSRTVSEKFKPDPTPVMSVTLIYYRPR
jgi:hypothetical protein